MTKLIFKARKGRATKTDRQTDSEVEVHAIERETYHNRIKGPIEEKGRGETHTQRGDH